MPDDVSRRKLLKTGGAGLCLAALGGGGLFRTVDGSVLESASGSLQTALDGQEPGDPPRPQTSAESGSAACRTEPPTDATGASEPSDYPVPAPNGAGQNHWLAFAWARNEAGFGRLQADMSVPSAPETYERGTVFFFFPALQSFGGNGGGDDYILQPVIAWNWAGSRRWQMAIWYGSADRGFEHSELVDVDPGDQLLTLVEPPTAGDSRWYLKVYNRTTGEASVGYSHRLGADRRFPYAYVAFEANGAFEHGRGDTVPGGSTISEIALSTLDGRRAPPDWTFTADDQLQCAIRAVPESDTAIQFVTPRP